MLQEVSPSSQGRKCSLGKGVAVADRLQPEALSSFWFLDSTAEMATGQLLNLSLPYFSYLQSRVIVVLTSHVH